MISTARKADKYKVDLVLKTQWKETVLSIDKYIYPFELWCSGRLLRVPWTARRSNQSILKEILPEYSLEGLMLKLKLQYFGHLMRRASSLEKTLMQRKIEGRRRRGQQQMRWLDGITDSMGMNLSKLGSWQEKAMATHSSIFAWKIPKMEEPGRLQSMGSQRIRHETERLHFHM